MTPDQYLALPTYPIVPLPEAFEDARGLIQNIFTDGVQSGALIISKKGSRRADHHHQKGDHLCLLASGIILYKWRDAGAKVPPASIALDASNGPIAWFTPAMVEHSMEMLTDTVFLAFDSLVARNHATYEADIVRLKEPLR